MKKFAFENSAFGAERRNEHGGTGAILFQRVLGGAEFQSPVDFIDYTHVLPGSAIGRHEHHGNEEVYFVASGNPLVRVDGEEARLQPGGFAIVRDGEWHELVNDTAEDVEILVIQIAIRGAA
ncbi:MAG: cupin domain-containing protein [Acidobacteriota bacterium]|nr:cupin domain-containing protein [Acidobacteriota bacterium]